MCMSISRYAEAKFSGTKIYAGEAEKDGKYVHVLAYQNSAETTGPNAMILPFPTDVPMGPDNVIRTSSFKKFLTNISAATKIETKGFSRGLRRSAFAAGVADSLAQVFDVGSYTIILADSVVQVPEALKRVAANRRPEVTTQFLLHFGRLYPKQPVALCCWDGRLEDVEPLLWWYEPKNPDTIFIPTMDAHNGGPPDLNAQVETDHVISVGSLIKSSGSPVRYSDKLGDSVRSLLPTHVHGHRPPRLAKNGDTFVSVDSLRNDGNNHVIVKRGANVLDIHSEHRMNGWQ